METNVTALMEAPQTEIHTDQIRKLWLEENRTAIEAYNRIVEENGLATDDLRSF